MIVQWHPDNLIYVRYGKEIIYQGTIEETVNIVGKSIGILPAGVREMQYDTEKNQRVCFMEDGSQRLYEGEDVKLEQLIDKLVELEKAHRDRIKEKEENAKPAMPDPDRVVGSPPLEVPNPPTQSPPKEVEEEVVLDSPPLTKEQLAEKKRIQDLLEIIREKLPPGEKRTVEELEIKYDALLNLMSDFINSK